MARSFFSILTKPYRDMVFKVRERLPCLRPVSTANSLMELGWAVRISANRARMACVS